MNKLASVFCHFIGRKGASEVCHLIVRSGDILPPLMLTHRSGGFLFDSPVGLSISRLSPRAPRFIFGPVTGFLFWFSLILYSLYDVISSLRPSSRILTAALTSRSIRFPHSFSVSGKNSKLHQIVRFKLSYFTKALTLLCGEPPSAPSEDSRPAAAEDMPPRTGRIQCSHSVSRVPGSRCCTPGPYGNGGFLSFCWPP